LDRDQDDACDGLRRLSDPKLLDEDEDADDGEHSNDLDENVDYVTRSSLVRTAPDEEAEHYAELTIVGKKVILGMVWYR
jgi:hypothetical protein